MSIKNLLVVEPGDYTLGYDGRTDSPQSAKSKRRAIVAALRRSGLEVCQFVRIEDDGSGVGWNEWPDGINRRYPVGTFNREL